MEQIIKEKNGNIMPFYKTYPQVFYEIILEKLCHAKGISRPSIKSISHWYKNCVNHKKWSGSKLGENIEIKKMSSINDQMMISIQFTVKN